MLTPALEKALNQAHQAFERRDLDEVLALMMPLARSGQLNEALTALNGRALFLTGLLFFYSPEEENRSEGINLWEMAAAVGDGDAQTALGELYFEGKAGVDEDKVKAVELWKEAAAAGNAEAQFKLSMLYAVGKGVPQNGDRAMKLLKMAAAGGSEGAKKALQFMSKDK